MGTGRERGPGRGSKVAGGVCSFQSSGHIYSFSSRWRDPRAWTLTAILVPPGRVCDPVLFGKPMPPSFPFMRIITVGSSLCCTQILLPPSGVEEEETHLTN